MKTNVDRPIELLLAIIRSAPDRFPEVSVYSDKPNYGIGQVYAYLRLSRDNEDSHSIERQRSKTEECAAREGWKILAVFDQDVDVSGKDFNRPDWNRLLRQLTQMTPAERKRTAVLCTDVDRFSRSVRTGSAMLEDLDAVGVRLRFSSYPTLYPEEPTMGRVQFYNWLVFAEQYRAIAIKNTIEGLEQARKEGVHLGHRPKHFDVNEDKQLVPTEIVRRVVELRMDDYSYEGIAKEVGIPKTEVYSICVFLAQEAQEVG